MVPIVATDARLLCQFVSAEGEETGGQIEVPAMSNAGELAVLVNALLQAEEPTPYTFYVEDTALTTTLTDAVTSAGVSAETVVRVRYAPQALFRVRPVTRCTADMPGHTESVLCAAFSPDGRDLATGSGDKTIRLWDLTTQTPRAVLRGHTNWVQQVAFSPCSQLLASAGADNSVRVWDPRKPTAAPRLLVGHRKWINGLSWEPFHLAKPGIMRFVTASADGTARIWNARSGRTTAVLSGHEGAVKDVRWGGRGLIYTCGVDRTVRVWNAATCECVRVLRGHGHWINSIALSTDYALRTGAYDHEGQRPEDDEAARDAAKKRYDAAAAFGERLASASDDHTIFLWAEGASQPTARLCGHSRPVNHIAFSPDGRTLASASFDKSVRLWDAVSGKLRAACRGHVDEVYRVAWSADSNLIVSGSKDSTLKCWRASTGKLATDLPGHAGAVFAVDWSPTSNFVASGGADKVVKLWRH